VCASQDRLRLDEANREYSAKSSAAKATTNKLLLYCDNKFLDGSDTSAPAVHFIRDPFEAVVSGFLYHMRGSEPTWTGKSLSLRPNNLPKCGGPTLSAITACTQIPFFHNNRLASKQRCPIASAEDFIAWCAELPPVTNTECYSGYLSRVHDMADWKHAVMTEMVRFEAYERGAWESTMEEHLRDSLNILHVCLDIFMFDEHSFQFGARAIMEHLKIPAEKSEIILTSMQKLNPHISAGAQEHGTSHDEHREVLLSIVKDVDMEFFGGRFLALAEVVSDACQRFQEVVASHQNI
jgi:hypothetical protein